MRSNPDRPISLRLPLATTIDFLRSRLTRAPTAVLVLGSGLDAVAEAVVDPLRLPYADIPGFPDATVAGHQGALVSGILEGVEVAVLAGRFHLYEGWSAAEVACPIRALAALGARHLLLTNAAGGIRPDLRAGDLMLIADHLNLMFRNPLIGEAAAGESRFPDMSDPYDRALRQAVLGIADDFGVGLTQGVYAGVLGPSYETPAEIRMLARLGADAVGMSTVPEVLAARALGMKVLAISCITNRAAELGGGRLTHEEVLEAGAAASGRLARLLQAVVPRILESNLPTEAAS